VDQLTLLSDRDISGQPYRKWQYGPDDADPRQRHCGLCFISEEQDPPFDRNCVELVIRRQRDYRANAIDMNESELIFQVIQEQRVKGDIEYDLLLRSLFVFEYRDHQGVWFAINPVLAETEKFKSWLKNSQQMI
jgi:hypothetical protein